jgi:hypothetical protein
MRKKVFWIEENLREIKIVEETDRSEVDSEASMISFSAHLIAAFSFMPALPPYSLTHDLLNDDKLHVMDQINLLPSAEILSFTKDGATQTKSVHRISHFIFIFYSFRNLHHSSHHNSRYRNINTEKIITKETAQCDQCLFTPMRSIS